GGAALTEAMFASMPPEMQAAFAPQIEALKAGQKQFSDSLNAYTGGIAEASAGLEKVTGGCAELAKSGNKLAEGIDSAVAPLKDMKKATEDSSKPESFISDANVSEIQFIMKTDALNISQLKEDVLPAEKPKETFWSRLLALFGL
ncbi:MAG: hypothetical protein RR177_01460, partial [Oscillospiraceae bacterium]